MPIRNIKLTIQYDGADYHGWQQQPGIKTVEGALTEAIEKLIGCEINLTGSSRTDAGVSALGQVANFKIDSPIPTENFAKAITSYLPDDIIIAEAVEVDMDFDAISSTKSKTYRYAIFTGKIAPILQIKHLWHQPIQLDADLMNAAAKLLVGKKDFKSFASAADNRQSSVRTILDCRVESQNDWVYTYARGDGFLYNMVRNIVGTLLEVGRGRWPIEKINEILEAKDRTAAGPIAPASGLCLMEIEY